MKSNEGYINIVAVMQKYFDQAISGNWSYNPDHFEDNQVPLSVMAQDLLTTYKLGWKTSYYQNTYDAKKDIDEPAHPIGFVDNVPEGPTNKMRIQRTVILVQFKKVINKTLWENQFLIKGKVSIF